MPNTLDTASGPMASLVTFTYGATPTVRRYALWTSDITIDGNTYAALPAMEIRYNEQHGGTQDVPTDIDIDQTVQPVVNMIGQPHPRVKCKIEEVNPIDPLTLRTTFEGVVGNVTVNVSGRNRVARVQLRSWKSLLGVPVGIQCNPVCDNRLGDAASCKVNLAPLRATGTISAIAGNVATITGLPGGRQWMNGYVEIDALRIGIRLWQASDAQRFVLRRFPPTSWTGLSAMVTPGCLKTSDGCLADYNNLANFNGTGRAMLDRNPLWESDV